MNEHELHLSEKAILNLIRALALEVSEVGDKEAALIMNDEVSDEQAKLLMKANTFLSVFAAFLLKVIKDNDTETATLVLNVWLSKPIRDLTSIAFYDEIKNADKQMQENINEIEKYLNKKEEK